MASPTAYRLAHTSAQASAEDFAHHLAELPKPVKVASKVEGTCVVVTVVALHEDPWAATRHRGRTLLRDEHPLDYLAKRYGGDPDELMITCHGAGELLRVSGRAIAKWERDYYHENAPDGGGWDTVDSGYAAARGVQLTPLDGPGFVDFGWAVDDEPPSHSRQI